MAVFPAARGTAIHDSGVKPVICVPTGSASIKGKSLFITLTNTHAVQSQEVTVNLLGGAQAADASASILTGEIHAHNTFDLPDALRLQPQPYTIATAGSRLVINLPPAAVLAATVNLT